MESDPETLMIYRIASHLKKTIPEILDLTAEEIRGWSMYLLKTNQ